MELKRRKSRVRYFSIITMGKGARGQKRGKRGKGKVCEMGLKGSCASHVMHRKTRSKVLGIVTCINADEE